MAGEKELQAAGQKGPPAADLQSLLEAQKELPGAETLQAELGEVQKDDS